MGHKNLIGLLILVVFQFTSCKENKDENPTNEPGVFVFSQINSMKSASINSSPSNSVSSNEFDLGEIKKSSQFYFSLSNGGGTPIFDISLRFRKTGFNIYPKVISSIGTNENLTLSPILKVGITHGLNLDGLGSAPLLDKGINIDTLSIYGKTLSGKDTIKIHLDVVIQANAKIADISLHNNSNDINLLNYSYIGSVIYGDSLANSGLDKIRSFIYSDSIKITNTGNVPLEISIFSRTDSIFYSQPDFNYYSVLQPGNSTRSLNLPLCQKGRFAYIYGVKVNSNGTVSEINKLPYGSDGKIYFALENYCN